MENKMLERLVGCRGRAFTRPVFLAVTAILMALIVMSVLSGCAGGPLSTREKGAGIGAVGGAAVGGIIGAVVGHPGAGAAIGGILGLGTGALIGDQMQGQENQQNQQQDELDKQRREIERQRREIERLRNR